MRKLRYGLGMCIGAIGMINSILAFLGLIVGLFSKTVGYVFFVIVVNAIFAVVMFSLASWLCDE